MRVGLNFAWQSQRLKAVLLRIFLFFLQTAGLSALLPLVASQLHGGGPTTFTVMLSCLGAGAIVAAARCAAGAAGEKDEAADDAIEVRSGTHGGAARRHLAQLWVVLDAVHATLHDGTKMTQRELWYRLKTTGLFSSPQQVNERVLDACAAISFRCGTPCPREALGITAAPRGSMTGCVTLLPGKMRSCALAVPLLRPLGPHTPSAKRLSNVLASRACSRSPASLLNRRLCDVGGAVVAASSVSSSSSPWSSPSEAFPRVARGGLGCGGGGLRFDGGALARTSAADMTQDAIAANLAASSASESESDGDDAIRFKDFSL
jgi:hypothetical protein